MNGGCGSERSHVDDCGSRGGGGGWPRGGQLDSGLGPLGRRLAPFSKAPALLWFLVLGRPLLLRSRDSAASWVGGWMAREESGWRDSPPGAVCESDLARAGPLVALKWAASLTPKAPFARQWLQKQGAMTRTPLHARCGTSFSRWLQGRAEQQRRQRLGFLQGDGVSKASSAPEAPPYQVPGRVQNK